MPLFTSVTPDSASLFIRFGVPVVASAIDKLNGSALMRVQSGMPLLFNKTIPLNPTQTPLFKRLGNAPSCRTLKPKQCGTCNDGKSYTRYADGRPTKSTKDALYDQLIGDELDYSICLLNYFEEGDSIVSYTAEMNGKPLPIFECNDRLTFWVSDLVLGLNNACVTVKSGFGRTKVFVIQIRGLAPKQEVKDCRC